LVKEGVLTEAVDGDEWCAVIEWDSQMLIIWKKKRSIQ
jgi:hypothetical protein